MSARRYNMSNLRAFLTQGFSAEELRTMCYDDPELYPVIEQLGEGMGKSRIVSQILEFCQQKLLLDRLLSVAGDLNPARYALHQPYYLGSAEPDASTVRTLELPASTPTSASPISTNVGGSGRRLKVFLCHASEDKSAVRALYDRLQASGVDPWLDQVALLPGQDWHLEIRKAVRETDVVLVCLSQRSVTKAGYVQRELRYALDIADEQPEGAIFVIPVRLQECSLPESLRRWQWVDLYREGQYDRLVDALRVRAEGLEGVILPSSSL